MAHLYPQRSNEFHTFGAASNPSSVQGHIECPQSDESGKSNANRKSTCRLFRGNNPNKLAESDKSDRSDTESVGLFNGWPPHSLADTPPVRGLPEALVSAAFASAAFVSAAPGATIVTNGLREESPRPSGNDSAFQTDTI